MIGLRKLIIAVAVFSLGSSAINIAVAQPMPGMETKEATGEGSNLMEKIKTELGKPLSLQQIQQMLGVIQENKLKMTSVQQIFIGEVSRITGVSASDILEMMPQIGQPNNAVKQELVQQVETILGTSLTPEQLEKIQLADIEKKDTILAVQESLTSQLSTITGLPVEAIAEMLPKIQR